MKKYIYLVLILFVSNAFGQMDYERADEIAKTTKYKGSLPNLVKELTQELDNEEEKTRAIYFWITENIAYDHKKFNSGKRVIKFKCKTKNECQEKRENWENKRIRKMLRRKKEICSGYSLLFKKMCDLAGINCLIIDGYFKSKAIQVGKMGVFDHSWNAVVIDNKTYYLDLTWASGYCPKDKKNQLKKFVKLRNDFYWFTPVEKFTIDHFPKKPEDVTNFNISKEEYKNQPYISSHVIPFLDSLSPKQGVIKPILNDTIFFKFDFIEDLEKLQINTNIKRNIKIYTINKKGEKVLKEKSLEKQEYIEFKKEKNSYTFFYVVKNDNLKFIEILFDHEVSIKYIVEMD